MKAKRGRTHARGRCPELKPPKENMHGILKRMQSTAKTVAEFLATAQHANRRG